MTDQQRQLHDESAQTREQYDFIINLAREVNIRLTRELRQIRKFWLNPAGAADLRRQLKDLRGANREFGRQLADVTSNREFWYKEAKDAETELDRVRQDAQDQSDEVQKLWLSPVKAEGLKRQLAKAQMQAAIPKEAAMWLWGFYDGNTLVAKPGYEDDIHEAWDRLLIAVDSIAGDASLERLATLDATEALLKDRQGSLDRACIELDAAEAALADCGIGGIFTEFDGLADAIDQMAQHIKELDSRLTQAQANLDAEPIEVEITGKEMVEALQSERALRQVAETGERAARKFLSQAIVAQADAELAAHVHSKAHDELTQAMHTERRLRQKAQSQAIELRLAVHKLELSIGLERQAVHTERQLRQEAERQVTATLYHYRDIANQYLQELCIEQRQRKEVKQRTEHAEALAQLVNEETAELVERLADLVHKYAFGKTAGRARALAAKIREALNDSQA